MNEPSQSQTQKRVTAVGAVITSLVVLLTLFTGLGVTGIVGPDEPRYAWIARAMAATGDWVTPRLYGQPWFEKPVLYYWTAAFGFLLHLPTEWALRLPSAVAALASAIAIGWIAAKFYGSSALRLTDPPVFAPLLFSTTVAGIGFARAATPDMLFSAFITLAMVTAASILKRANALGISSNSANSRSANTSPLALLLFGAFLGLAVLAKGPAAILLAGGAIALWAAFTRKWPHAFRLAHPYTIVSFCVVALPWYVLCALRNPDFLRVFIFQHNFERYLTPVFQHRQPFWFFVPITLLALLPWTALLWPAAASGLDLWRAKSWIQKPSPQKPSKCSPGFFFACWAAFPIIFFSFSQSKLPSYILPAIPAIALLCAIGFPPAAKDHSAFPAENTVSSGHAAGPSHMLDSARIGRRRVGVAVAITWIILGASARLWMHRIPSSARQALGHLVLAAAIISVVGGVAMLYFVLRGGPSFVAASFFLVVLLLEVANLGILPALDPYISARWHAQLMSNDLHPDRIFTYRLQRSWNYGLNFYFARELPEWSPADPNPALILTGPAGLESIRQLHRLNSTLDEPYKGILYVPVGPKPR